MRSTRWAAGLLAAAALAVVAWGPAGAQDKKATKKHGSTAASAPATKAPVVDYAKRFAATCAACHGANGRGEMQGVPVLAGQPSLYVITQLYLFREGRRPNEAMTAVAKTMTDDDMRGFADYVGTLPAVPPPAATDTDAQRMAQGRALAEQYKCLFCHGANLEGGQQVPRIGGQKQQYLHDTLLGFKSGKRPAYTQAMVSALSPVPEQDLDTLAYFASRIPAAPAAK